MFALYIVTLPDMTPMKALRSARELVRYRRWTVLRKVLFLPLMLLVVAAIIMVPIIILADAAGPVGILPADHVRPGGRPCLYVHAVPGAA